MTARDATLAALLLEHPFADDEPLLLTGERTVTAGEARRAARDIAARLTEAGLLSRRHIGRSTMVRANSENRLVAPLTELLLLSWGPQQVIADEFAGIGGTEQVLIFGSWAARYRQQPGPLPHDLDVLVVGVPERSVVYDAADRAQQRLAMPVNPVIRTGSAWSQPTDALIRQIRAQPHVIVLMADGTGGSDEHAEAESRARE